MGALTSSGYFSPTTTSWTSGRSRGGGSILGNALERRRAAQLLRDLRRELGWQEVPVMRHRERALGVVESPLDRFGPEAPPSVDYARDLPPDAELRTSRP